MQEEKGAPPKNKEALDEFYGGKNTRLNGSAMPTLPPEAKSKLMIFPAITVCNLNMFKVLVLTEEDWYQTAHKLFDMVDETGDFVEEGTISKYFKGDSAKNLQKAVQRIKTEYNGERRRRKKRSHSLRSPKEVRQVVLDQILKEKRSTKSDFEVDSTNVYKSLEKSNVLKNLNGQKSSRRSRRVKRQLQPRETINKKPSRQFEVPKTSVQQIMVQKPRNPASRLPIIKEWNMLDFINRTGFHKDDILLECKFRGTDCKEDKFWKTVSTLNKLKVLFLAKIVGLFL